MILSRYLPPSRRPTGCPVTFPKMSHRAMSTPLIAWVIAPPAALPEGVLVQLLRDALRLEGVLAQVQRLQHLEGGTHQRLAREDAAVADGSLVGVNGHQGVNDIVRFQLLAPAALWGRSLEADGAYLPYPHARVRPSLRRSSPGTRLRTASAFESTSVFGSHKRSRLAQPLTSLPYPSASRYPSVRDKYRLERGAPSTRRRCAPRSRSSTGLRTLPGCARERQGPLTHAANLRTQTSKNPMQAKF